MFSPNAHSQGYKKINEFLNDKVPWTKVFIQSVHKMLIESMAIIVYYDEYVFIPLKLTRSLKQSTLNLQVEGRRQCTELVVRCSAESGVARAEVQ